MGFKIAYNIETAAIEINAAAHQATNPRNDGWIGWGAKQDLYRLKWLLDDALKRCPTFSGEQEWIREQEKQRVIGFLKDEN